MFICGIIENWLWMLPDKSIYKHKKIFIRLCKDLLDILKKYKKTYNILVDLEDHAACRFAFWLGFKNPIFRNFNNKVYLRLRYG